MVILFIENLGEKHYVHALMASSLRVYIVYIKSKHILD